MNKTRCRYQDTNAEMTLREGVEDYYRANPHLLLPSNCSADAARFFRNHDFIHVVFGCATSFLDEARADWWTIFGSDAGLLGYFRHAAKGAIRELYRDAKKKATPEDRRRMRDEIKRDARAALATPLAIFRRTRKMAGKWPWEGAQRYLDQPLKNIRRDFNIQIFE
jgi:ubiquinone biosynthesis protein Coq4